MTRREGIALAAFLLVAFLAGAVGLRLQAGPGVTDAYRSLPLPSFAPAAGRLLPGWVLASVLLGVSAWIVWRRWGWGGSGGALNMWVVQLLLHAALPPVLLGMRDVGLALIVAVLLFFAAIATVTAFRRRSASAAWLLVPYALTVAFTTLVTGAMWWAQA